MSIDHKIMMLRLERLYLKPKYTIGRLIVDGSYCCDTLEDAYRDLSVEPKIDNETCIPYGKYKVIMDFSNRFQKVMPHILNVPHFTGIRIHGGNTDKDTSGCILLGKNTIRGGLTESGFYSRMVNSLLTDATNKKQSILISIV